MNMLNNYAVQISMAFNVANDAGFMLTLYDVTLILALVENDNEKIISAIYGYGDILNKKLRVALEMAFPAGEVDE